MTCPRVAVSLWLAAVAASFPAAAQSVISTHSGVVYFFEGSVFLGDQTLEQKFGKFPDIGEGRELRTAQGRAEVLLTPGVFLRMAENSRVRMLSSSLSDTRVELLDGSITVESGEATADTSAVVVYKSWKVRVPHTGIYRIDAEPPQVRVFKGEAEVSAGSKAETVIAKEGQLLPLSAVLLTEEAIPTRSDAFDNWAMARSQAIFADNSTAAQIFDDPSMIDNSGLALGGLSYFPMGIPALGLASPYGLSFWSPFQPTLNSLYVPRYGAGWAYPSFPGGLRYLLLPQRGIGSPLRIGGGIQPGGIPTSRVPSVYSPPRVAPRPAVGVHGGVHR